MILRKPYAILIKYFKLIHIIMFIFFGYFVFVLRKIYLFFSEYVKTSNFTYFEDMTSRYIPSIVFFMIVILLIFAISIFLLMRKKDKPVLFYRLLIVYTAILLIAFIYFLIFFKSLDTNVYEPLRIVINRDIVLFLYIINFVFVALTFIRGFGFDIKKFSFDKDKKELHLEESDSEEYELNVSLEKEDLKNYFNKQKRELKYYVKENSLILSIVGGVLVLALLIFVYRYFFVENKVYKENNEIEINKIVYKVNNSYITSNDKYGKVIDKQGNYLVIDLTINDNLTTGYLDKQAMRIQIDEEYYYPLISTCDLFDDLGVCYKNNQLKVNNSYNYILVFKIKKDNDSNKKIYFEILKSKGTEYKYNRVLLSPKSITASEENYSINSPFTINNNTHQILNYEIVDKTNYEYEECINEKCNKYIKNISPKTGESVLVIEISDLDKIPDSMINSSIGLKINDKTVYGSDIKYIDKHDNKLYYSVSNSIKNANKITLIFTTRSKKINVLLKGE